MNDWISLFNPANPIRTPALQSLAQQSVFFSQGYCNAPACCPSRASLWNGLYPSTTGVYSNASDWKRAIPDYETLPAYFRKRGYKTIGAGKIFHHASNAFVDSTAFDEVLPFPTGSPDSPMPPHNLNGTTYWYGQNGQPIRQVSVNMDWGVWPQDSTQAVDERTVRYLEEKLQRIRQPFFMAAGIFRPHMPFYVPQSELDAYPLTTLQLPSLLKNDVDDLASGGMALLRRPTNNWWTTIQRETQQRDSLYYKRAIQGYQAAATYSDRQIGRLLKALQNSPAWDNTVIVLVADHGYHLGQKEHWEKFLLYEQTTHIPFLISAPGLAKGQRCQRPVSLVDLYPTLLDLCGLPQKSGLEGHSLVPLLKKPTASWPYPALMTYLQGNHAVRDEEWRYIHYSDNSEELYHTHTDPNEWSNLANDPAYAPVKKRLAKYLPTHNADPVANVKN